MLKFFFRKYSAHVALAVVLLGSLIFFLPFESVAQVEIPNNVATQGRTPTPQFYVAKNDYALGRLVEKISGSPYWKDAAIFVVEDDAQDGPDHVDAHRSPALVISAYNRKGALIHDFHDTVSLIRTMEICLGLPPMNFLDANAVPIDVFTNAPDFAPYRSSLPDVALDNLFPPKKASAAMWKYMRLTDKQNLEFADMANPRELNEIIWFSVRGRKPPMPEIARLPMFDLLTAGIRQDNEEENEADE
jgi:hypothetical protein